MHSDTMVDPVAIWMTAIAPSGLVVYFGTKFQKWLDIISVGGLKPQDIRRIDLNEVGQVVGQ